MTAPLPPGEPVYPPNLAEQAWGAPQWQQQWVEASHRWALGSVFVLQKNGGLSKEDTYDRRACLPGLAPWLENLTVRVYDQRHSPQPFDGGLAVDPALGQVWIERSWVERQADLPEDQWSRDSWHTQGWAELWVRVAMAMGAPEALALPLLNAACLRERLDTSTQKVLWRAPVVLSEPSAARKGQGPDVLVEPVETLLKSQVEARGGEVVRVAGQMWSLESTPWTGFVRAARWMASSAPPRQRAQQADLFLERAVRAEDLTSFRFWVDQVDSGLEQRLPGLLGRVRNAKMVAPLVAKGADPNVQLSVDFEGHLSVLANAIVYAPSVVGALMSNGARWDSVPNHIDAWESLAGQLGQAYAWEWAGILEGLERLPRTPIEGHVPAKMVENFFKNHRFRTTDQDRAAHVLKSTLAWMLEVSPALDVMPTLAVFVKASTPAYDESLKMVLDRLKAVDLNTVTVDGRQRLPIALVEHGAFAWDLNDAHWRRHAQLWEEAGVAWKREPEELKGAGETTLSFFDRLRRPQEARQKSQALEQVLGQPSRAPSRPRM